MLFRNFDDGGFVTRYDTLHKIFLKLCGFTGCWDENHRSALK